jgi:hypothetical protein
LARIKNDNPILATYQVKTPNAPFLILVSVIAFLALLLPLLSLLINVSPDFNDYGLLFVVHKNYILAGLFFIGLLIITILFFLNYDRTHQKIVIYKNGILIHLKKSYFLNWDQIAGISTKFVQYKLFNRDTTKSIKCNILTTKGKWVQIPPSIFNPTHFLTILKSQIYPLLQPKIISQLNEKRIVYFGGISIKDSYLFYKKKNYKIEQIKSASIKSGHLLIKFLDSTKKIKIPIYQLINSELLLNILNG